MLIRLPDRDDMDLIAATVLLRSYVFLFLAAFLGAGVLDLGWRRTMLFTAIVWPLAWVAEFSSTRTGIPFGLYHYTGVTRGRELYIANVPFMDPLSFTFLAYAAFCLARVVLVRTSADRGLAGGWLLAVLGGGLMMLLDVVIDPLAVRGDRWFLGRIFYYSAGGVYWGVPLSNFAGWWIVGAAGIGAYLAVARGAGGRRPWPGVALYYGVLGFNLAVTMWIGEWGLCGLGLAVHASVAATVRYIVQRAAVQAHLGGRQVQSA